MIETRPLTDRSVRSVAHPNVGKMVLYRTGNWPESTMPAVVLAQIDERCDLAVFTYGHSTVTQLGALMIDGPDGMHTAENVCWLVA